MANQILLIGARGRVGREVVRALVRRGVHARALLRPGGAVPEGVTPVVGDLRDPAALAAALAGVERAFFVTPHDPDEAALGCGFVAAAERAGVARLVFASALHEEFPSRFAFSLFVGAMSLLTHYGPKLRVEQRVRRSPASPVVLMPSNFYQNDELFRDELLAGLYPQPLGRRGVNRVDCRDIGEAAARALVDDDVQPGAYPLVGPESTLTIDDCARTWAAALGREVRTDDDIAAWRDRVAARMHARERDDFGKTYAIFHRVRVAARPEQLARCEALLGRPATRYAAYVADCAAQWTAADRGPAGRAP